MKVRDDFALGLLELERDSVSAQLSLFQRDFEFKQGHLNFDLLALKGELDSVHQELSSSQDRKQVLMQELAALLEKLGLAEQTLMRSYRSCIWPSWQRIVA